MKDSVIIIICIGVIITNLIWLGFQILETKRDYFYADSTYFNVPINWTEMELQREECNKPFLDYMKNTSFLCNVTGEIGNCYLLGLEYDKMEYERDLCLIRYALY